MDKLPVDAPGDAAKGITPITLLSFETGWVLNTTLCTGYGTAFADLSAHACHIYLRKAFFASKL